MILIVSISLCLSLSLHLSIYVCMSIWQICYGNFDLWNLWNYDVRCGLTIRRYIDIRWHAVRYVDERCQGVSSMLNAGSVDGYMSGVYDIACWYRYPKMETEGVLDYMYQLLRALYHCRCHGMPKKGSIARAR